MSHSAEPSNEHRASTKHTRHEFVGVSDDTIADAVRRALSNAAATLRTLEGLAILVIPQTNGRGHAPRYRVTLEVTGSGQGRTRAKTPALS